ncbi:MAG: hypothetical protein L3J14_09575 [Flavobacteriaceae bacterium]|nr:hypothetical protein [Flavobacteriaceae bacterium]
MTQKITKIFIISIVVFFIASGFTAKITNASADATVVKVAKLKLYYTVLNEDEIEESTDFSIFLGKSFTGFKEALGFKESQGRYSAINSFGYLGKYQFGKSTLKMLGVYNMQYFINSSLLQEKAFEANLSRNKWVLRRDIKRFVGKTISGVKVTESGILAAAHLGGPGSVKKFLRSYGKNTFSDANGISVRIYMKKFAGYNVSHLVENQKAKAKSS